MTTRSSMRVKPFRLRLVFKVFSSGLKLECITGGGLIRCQSLLTLSLNFIYPSFEKHRDQFILEANCEIPGSSTMKPSENPVDRQPSCQQNASLSEVGQEADYDSVNLFGERMEITICHNGECYRLRKTKTGKLILNK